MCRGLHVQKRPACPHQACPCQAGRFARQAVAMHHLDWAPEQATTKTDPHLGKRGQAVGDDDS